MTAYDAVSRIVGLPEGVWWQESGVVAVLMRGNERVGAVRVRDGRFVGQPAAAAAWSYPCGNVAGVVQALLRGQSASCPAPKWAK